MYGLNCHCDHRCQQEPCQSHGTAGPESPNKTITQTALAAISDRQDARETSSTLNKRISVLEWDSVFETIRFAAEIRYTFIALIYVFNNIKVAIPNLAQGRLMRGLLIKNERSRKNFRLAYQILVVLQEKIDQVNKRYYQDRGWKNQQELCTSVQFPTVKDLEESGLELKNLNERIAHCIQILEKYLEPANRCLIPKISQFRGNVEAMSQSIVEGRFQEYMDQENLDPHCTIAFTDKTFTLLGFYLYYIAFHNKEITGDHLEDIEHLLMQDIDPNFIVLKPRLLTALSYCLINPKFLEVFQLLLRYGANPYLTDQGKFNLQTEKDIPYHTVTELLEDKQYLKESELETPGFEAYLSKIKLLLIEHMPTCSQNLI